MSKRRSNLSVVRKLLDKFNLEGIRYCHWKSNEHFCDALTGIDDLDILIDRSQYGKISNILQELDYKRFYTPSVRTYVGIEDFLGFDCEQGILIHLHLHSRLVVGEKHLKGFHLPIESMILDHRRFDEEYGVYMSSYFDEMLLLILRMGMKVRRRDFYKSKMMTGSAKEEFDWLKDRCGDFQTELNSVFWLTKCIKNLIMEIYNGKASWFVFTELKRFLYSDLAPYAQGSGFYNTIKRNSREAGRAVLEIKKRYLHTRNTFTRRRPAAGGLIIAFLGSDGAGKSSAIEAIYKWLFPFMDVRYFYLGSGDGNSSFIRIPLKAALRMAQNLGIVRVSNNFSDDNLSEINSRRLSGARKLWVFTLSAERIK